MINTRDLGGLPLRDGRRTAFDALIRCGSGTSAIPPVARVLAARHGRVRLVDLRGDGEVVDEPDHQGILVRRLTMSDPVHRGRGGATRDAAYFVAHYRRLLPRAFEVAGEVMSILADDPSPVVVTCRLGKDRTGLVVMVVLRVLGVAPRWIVRDFALTARFFTAAGEWVDQYASTRGEPPVAVLRRLVLPPSVPVRTLAEIDRLAADAVARHALLGIDEQVARRAALRLTLPGGAP